MTTKFEGFHRKVRYMPVPGPMLGALLEQIDDLDELKCTLRLVAMLHQKRGHPRFVSLIELQTDRTLARALSGDRASASDKIKAAIAAAVTRGTVVSSIVEDDGRRHQLFALNTVADRAAMAKLSGTNNSSPDVALLPVRESQEEPPDRPNIFCLYEQNIGLINPMIADELREAEEIYPDAWIEDAFREAVRLNKRNWKYIARILERWEHEGRGHGRPGRYSKKTLRY